MGVSVYLDLDAQEREIEVPVNPDSREAGTVRVTVRELPHGKFRALHLRYVGALTAYEKLRAALESGAVPSAVEADALGAALGALYDAQAEAVRWGVIGHRAEDFQGPGGPIPFEAGEAPFNGVAFKVASPRTLRLYLIAGKGRPGDPGTLLPALASAVLSYQRGTVETPEEIWARP